MITSIIPIVCGQVIVSLTIDSKEKAAQAARIEKLCEAGGGDFGENGPSQTGMPKDVQMGLSENVQKGAEVSLQPAVQTDTVCGNIRRISSELARISQLCEEADISYTHMYIWRRDRGFAVNAAGYLRYRRWARSTGSRPVLHRQM